MRSSKNTVLRWGSMEVEAQLCKADVDNDVKLESADKVVDMSTGEITYHVPAKKVQHVNGEIVKGRWVDGEFKEVSAEKLAEIDEITAPTEIDVSGFMRKDSFPLERIYASHVLQCKNQNSQADINKFGVLYHALKETGAGALVKFGVGKRQRIGMLHAVGTELIVSSLQYEDNWHEPDDKSTAQIRCNVDAEAVKIAIALMREQVIDKVAVANIQDDREILKQELIDKALEGTSFGKPEAEPEPDAESVLSEALRRKLEA